MGDVAEPWESCHHWLFTESATSRWYSASNLGTTALAVYSSSNPRSPARPNRARISASLLSLAMARANASGSPGGTSSPVSPWTTMSAGPPIVLAMTDLPLLIASMMTSPNASGVTDGATPNRHRSQAAITTAWGALRTTVTPLGKSVGVSGQGVPINTSGGGATS